MLEIAKYYLQNEGNLNRIDGISFKDENGKIVRNKPRPLIENLDILPFPMRDFLVPSKNRISETAPVSTSRGCPYKCIFCSAGAMSGGKYRMRSAKNVVEEIKTLKEKGIKTVHFVDDTITIFPKRLIEICDLLEPLHIEWSAESRVDVISKDKELVKIMKKSGCIALQFGVESASQLILNNINKKIKIGQIIKAIEFAREEDITVACSMIIGHPDDTFESVSKSIDFGIELEKKLGAAVFFGILTPYPGTYVYNFSNLLGIKIHSYNYDDYILSNPVISTKHLSKDDLRWLYINGLQRALENIPTN